MPGKPGNVTTEIFSWDQITRTKPGKILQVFFTSFLQPKFCNSKFNLKYFTLHSCDQNSRKIRNTERFFKTTNVPETRPEPDLRSELNWRWFGPNYTMIELQYPFSIYLFLLISYKRNNTDFLWQDKSRLDGWLPLHEWNIKKLSESRFTTSQKKTCLQFVGEKISLGNRELIPDWMKFTARSS